MLPKPGQKTSWNLRGLKSIEKYIWMFKALYIYIHIPEFGIHSYIRPKIHIRHSYTCLYMNDGQYYLLPAKDVYNLGGPLLSVSLHVFWWYPIGLRFSYTSTTLWGIGFGWAITHVGGYRFSVGPYRQSNYFFKKRCPAED